MTDDGMKKYIEELRKRGQILPPNPEAVRAYEESWKELWPKIEADLKASARAAHFCRLGIPDPRKAIATETRRAETENTGSVHEGAGPQDIAQPQSDTPQ